MKKIYGRRLKVVAISAQKKVPHTKYQLTGNIAKIFLLQGRYREKEKGGKEGNTSQKSFKQMKHYMNKLIVKLSHQKNVESN